MSSPSSAPPDPLLQPSTPRPDNLSQHHLIHCPILAPNQHITLSWHPPTHHDIPTPLTNLSQHPWTHCPTSHPLAPSQGGRLLGHVPSHDGF